jgi:hypothetical protein
MRSCLAALALVLSLTVLATPASAAAPDGAGPWADTVVKAKQARTKAGRPVVALRSQPAAALGVAEGASRPDKSPHLFFSLGFGGKLVLGFDNPICNRPSDGLALELVESTSEPYIDELVDVYVSSDGQNWTVAATDVNKDARIALPAGVTTARYVKLVDTTDPVFSRWSSDGYDVDGVQALAAPGDCGTPPPPPLTPPPGGKTPPNMTAGTTPDAGGVLGSSARKCVSRRLFPIKVRVPRHFKVKTARIYVNGKRVRIIRGDRLRARVNLRGLPKGRFTVKIVLDGKRAGKKAKVVGKRRYFTCIGPTGRGTIPKV